jgi:anti-anti-sigma factor
MDQLQIQPMPGSLPDVTILALEGPLTIGTVFEFQNAVRQPDLKSTIIDFSAVPYMDSVGLGSLLSHWAHTQRIGVHFAAVGISDRVRVLLDMSRVSTILPMFSSVADAEREFSSVGPIAPRP